MLGRDGLSAILGRVESPLSGGGEGCAINTRQSLSRASQDLDGGHTPALVNIEFELNHHIGRDLGPRCRIECGIGAEARNRLNVG